VIVLDANILLYAYDPTAREHGRARAWLEGVLSERTPIGIPWQTVHAFLRIATNPKIGGKGASPEQTAAVVEEWLAQPNVRLLVPGDEHWSQLRRMMIEGQARGPLVTDAQLAALAIEHGGELYTTDRDFARFPGLRWKNPLSD